MTDYKDPYIQKVRFLDTFKFFYHTGGCFAHLVGLMPIIPLMYATMQDISEDMERLWWITQYAKKAIYTTQVIFFISGFFSCYYVYPMIKKADGKIGFFGFVFKRWLRTAPTTFGAIMLMFAASVFYHGPIVNELMDKHFGNCRNNWWQTAFYVNNWMSFNDICLPQTWSQSVDLQLWIISYFPLIWLVKRPRLGVYSCLFMIAMGVLIPAAVIYAYDLPSIASGRPIDLTFFMIHGNQFPRMHLHAYNNLSSYFIGILLGYTFATNWKINVVSFIGRPFLSQCL